MLKRIVRKDERGFYVKHEGAKYRCPARLVPRLREGQRVRMNFGTPTNTGGIAWLSGTKHEDDLMWVGIQPIGIDSYDRKHGLV